MSITDFQKNSNGEEGEQGKKKSIDSGRLLSPLTRCALLIDLLDKERAGPVEIADGF